MKRLFNAVAGIVLAVSLGGVASAATPQRLTITGEVIDSWCYLTEIMYPLGSAHHLCAVWCAVGGIPAGILGEDGTVYIVLGMAGDSRNVSNPTLLDLQTHKITVEGGVFERDGINYLMIDRLIEDQGIVNLTHDDYGIQPFGE